MLVVEPRALLGKLNATCARALEGAASACMSSRHYEVTLEHLLTALLDEPQSDVRVLLTGYAIDVGSVRGGLQHALGDLRSGNAGKPVFSSLLLEALQDAWLYVSAELGETKIRSGAILVRIALASSRYMPSEVPALAGLPRDDLRKNLAVLAATSGEAAEATSAVDGPAREGGRAATGSKTQVGQPEGPLARYTTDLTERARAGELDPVFGREPEIRQIVDILVRRRKNNPVIVGEAGVGKTALVEGLAMRIAEGSVPAQLKDVHVLSLDLGALQAGAGVKGEFENRLKGVIAEVKSSAKPIVLFIDEAHTIIGAGGPQGGGDAANLLKPALARGELRTIAATTWVEYKKYFEKDAALERRFQPVKVDEPSVEAATLMLRGLAKRFEEAHGVIIADAAVRAAVSLSSRYISGRLLPDKAVDLLDTSAARVKVLRAAQPGVLEDIHATLAGLERELEASDRDAAAGFRIDADARKLAEQSRDELKARAEELEARTKSQREIVARVDELRAKVKEGNDPEAKDLLRTELDRLAAIKPEDLLVHADVDESLVASVVGDWTGIPVGKMVKDDIQGILNTEQRLRQRVRGQDKALEAIARELRAARAGLKSTSQPMGVFLLVGPSGVGKTETALGLADLLFGGERFMVTINMSEFQEKHTVSRLIGSPPGYVGFGQGGVLTEAVRQRPYSVVLLDEVEKANKEVLNIFYQVFDKGMLADGEGRIVDFKNTVIIMTSNLATDIITEAAAPGTEAPALDDLVSLIKPTLSAHFLPALLARFSVVPYIPISPEALAGIARMKLDALAKRAWESQRIKVEIDEKLVETVAARCREVESGARNVDHILRAQVMPLLSTEILTRMAEETVVSAMRLTVDGAGSVVVEVVA